MACALHAGGHGDGLGEAEEEALWQLLQAEGYADTACRRAA